MQRTESKFEQTALIKVVDRGGAHHNIVETSELVRYQFLDNTWSEWKTIRRTFRLGPTEAIQMDDQTFQLIPSCNLLTRCP